mgnify:CR=1 FL=1
MAMSGMSFTGSDIGGFAEQPSGELFARWIQLGVFHPFCRVHSSGDHGHQEPWSFDEEVTNITRKFIEIRYQLLPYLYTMFYEYTENGIPMLKSLMYYDQDDLHTHYRNDEFIFGNHILVCPILEPNSKGRRMYIPRGNWYNYWGGEITKGGKECWVEADIDKIPIFIKEGAIITAYDPVASLKSIFSTHKKKYQECANALDAIKKSDALLIFTEWKEFWSIDINIFKKYMNHPVVFDGRNIYSPEVMKENKINYFSFGRNTSNK